MENIKDIDAAIDKALVDAEHLTPDAKNLIREKYKTMMSKAKGKMPKKNRFVTTEHTRFKMTMLNDSSIIITQITEDQANHIYEHIENAS